jgi:hypothetical protein
VVPRACQAKRPSTASKDRTRSSGDCMRRMDGSNTVVTKATPPIHGTTPSTCSILARVA